MGFQVEQTFFRRSLCRAWQFSQRGQCLRALQQISRREFADHDAVGCDLSALQPFREGKRSAPEEIDPDGGIRENDHRARVSRRRVGVFSFGIEAPIFARRLAASRSIRARNPSRTSFVFSVSPVYFCADASKSSSMLSVVLMHTMMADLYASSQVEPRTTYGVGSGLGSMSGP